MATKISNSLATLATIITAVTAAKVGTGTDNPLYNTALLTGAIRLNATLGSLRIASTLTSLKNKLAEIFEATNHFPVSESVDTSLGTKVTNALTNLASIVNALVATTIANPFNNITARTNSIQMAMKLGEDLKSANAGRKLTNLNVELGSVFQNAITIANGFSSMTTPNLDDITKGLDAYFGTEDGLIARLDAYFGGGGANEIATRVASITDNLKGKLTSDLHTMVTTLNAFNRDLANLNAPLDVTLKRYADGLGAHQTATVKNAAVNATINVNIKLEAGQVSQALFDFSSAQTKGHAIHRHIKKDSFSTTPET